MSEESLFEASLCNKCFDVAGDILSSSCKCLTKPFEAISESWNKLPNAGLFFCGFSIILVPLIIIHWVIIIGILLAELLVLVTIGIVLGIIFILIGIWPSFIITFDITGITIIRLPWNVFYHCQVTYRTVMLRRNLKFWSFILLPFVHLLVPVFTFLICLLTLVPWFAAESFAGYPIKQWKRIPKFHAKFWKKFVADVQAFSRRFGHPSGIPYNWDGRVYGLPIDPITVIIGLILYFISLLPISIGVFVIFAIKTIPIFLGTMLEFWKTLNKSQSLRWYRRVCAGSEEQPQLGIQDLEIGLQTRNEVPSQETGPPSGHEIWSSKLKEFAKGTKMFIERYAKFDFCSFYGKQIAKHAKRITKLKPSILCKIVEVYFKDCCPCNMLNTNEDSNGCLVCICMFIPMVLATILWTAVLVLVLIIPSVTFLLGFLLWVLWWVPVLILPVFYLLPVFFGLPLVYIFVWILILVGPWIFAVLGMCSGPFLALEIPFNLLCNDFDNPLETGSVIKRSLLRIPRILKCVDKFTGNLSI